MSPASHPGTFPEVQVPLWGTKRDAEGSLSPYKPWSLLSSLPWPQAQGGHTWDPDWGHLAGLRSSHYIHYKVSSWPVRKHLVSLFHSHNKNMRLAVKTNYQHISWSWTPSWNSSSTGHAGKSEHLHRARSAPTHRLPWGLHRGQRLGLQSPFPF